ncbi:MAG: hypothetical protein WAK52_04910 [Trichococcus sp.]
MDFKVNFLKNIKTPITVISSALIATFIYSIASIFLDPKDFEKIVWLIDTTIYSYILGFLWDGFEYLINQKRTLVEFSFSNPKQNNNVLVLNDSKDFKNIKLDISIKGSSHLTNDILRIYEPEGMTLQLINKPDYIETTDESYYEINLSNLIGVKRGVKKSDLDIKRSIEFQITLDDYESEYKDEIYVHRKKVTFLKSLLLSVKQNKMRIENRM